MKQKQTDSGQGWVVKTDNRAANNTTIRSGLLCIATVNNYIRDYKSHAKLISAAPDLLAALTYTNMDSDHDGYFCNCPLGDGTRPDKDHATSCVDARKAIDKAKGDPCEPSN